MAGRENKLVSSIEDWVELEMKLRCRILWVQSEVKHRCALGGRQDESEDARQGGRLRRERVKGCAPLLQPLEVNSKLEDLD